MQNGVGTTGTLGIHKICGGVWNQVAALATHATICSWTVPFRIGVRFDVDETIAENTADAFDHIENEDPAAGEGMGYTGFWLSYWQNTC